MEKNFNTDNFEQLLRESTDNFRMYPSKRVWHGIYNDLHPAKKWPSFAILLLLVTSIMYIGVTNPDKGGQMLAVASTDPNQASAPLTADKFTPTSVPNSTGVTVTNTRNLAEGSVAGTTPPSDIPKTNHNLHIASRQNNAKADQRENVRFQPMMSVVSALSPENQNQKSDDRTSKDKTVSSTVYQPSNANVDGINTVDETSVFNSLPLRDRSNMIDKKVQFQRTTTTLSIIKPASTTTLATNKVTSTSSVISNTDQSGWMEDFAFRNLKPRNNWKGRMAYQIYVTPSIGYRTLSKNAEQSLPAENALVVNPYAPTSTNYALNHSSAINLEIGGGIIYSASKMLRLKAGMQFNYANYSINAMELNHPTFTAIMLNNTLSNVQVLSTRTTSLANAQGPTSKYLNNSSYQVSIPMGVDLKIAGNDKLKVYLGATVQPTFILGGQSYLISSDMKNYVPEESFLRKINLNGSVESFISYKSPSGVTINAGPQFRYQFFSSYNKTYTYDEKLYNLGVKLGMTKNF